MIEALPRVKAGVLSWLLGPESPSVRYFTLRDILDRPAKPHWTQLGFPRMWETDALEMLGIMVRLGVRDSRLQDAADLVRSKQDDAGRWVMERSFSRGFIVSLERVGQPSKWVTLKALTALGGLYGWPKDLTSSRTSS